MQEFPVTNAMINWWSSGHFHLWTLHQHSTPSRLCFTTNSAVQWWLWFSLAAFAVFVFKDTFSRLWNVCFPLTLSKQPSSIVQQPLKPPGQQKGEWHDFPLIKADSLPSSGCVQMITARRWRKETVDSSVNNRSRVYITWLLLATFTHPQPELRLHPPKSLSLCINNHKTQCLSIWQLSRWRWMNVKDPSQSEHHGDTTVKWLAGHPEVDNGSPCEWTEQQWWWTVVGLRSCLIDTANRTANWRAQQTRINNPGNVS